MTENAVPSSLVILEGEIFRDSRCLIARYKSDFSCSRDSIDRNILATSKILQMTVYESLMSLQC